MVGEKNTFVECALGLGVGLGVPILGFRIVAPESVFPVEFRHGRSAHLDVSGARGEAIRRAMREQLGLEAGMVEPFGLAGSGGCTPLRIGLDDTTALFGKLYATSHLRADRWYKLGRTILYGALEDERSFNSVRRMAEYEDYMLRYLRDEGIRTAEPFGFVELTPEREYLLLCGFVDDAVEMLDAEVTHDVIRSGVGQVRALWDGGIAHRDIKPSNLLVRRSEVVLIDVFFCQVRPSPWRQSVDLANMLLTLALGADSKTVYEIALERFTPAEIAEGFAASRGVTIPSQLRHELARVDRDLPKEFRALGPAREPIRIQRWTFRRLALTATLVATLLVAIVFTLESLRTAGFRP
jgi:tRNA A-37 threonylcarbamoyl transferase component Bud32